MTITGTRTPRVVVGYDASASAKTAVDWAADEAARRAVPLTVVHAADYTGLVGGPISTSPWLPGVAIDEARRITQRGADQARSRQPGLEVHAATLVASPGTGLIEESKGAALVVVGTRGHGEVTGLLLGSVAARVAAHAHCPVVVIRGDSLVAAGPDRPVVVAVDGSPAAREALRVAVAQAQASHAPLRIVCAWRTTMPGAWDHEFWLTVAPDTDPDESACAAAEDVAREAAATALELAPDLDVEIRVAGGYPPDVILDAAGDAGLVVVGSRGSGSLTGMFLGSVSHGVVHGANRPVLVVRATEAEHPEATSDEKHQGAGSTGTTTSGTWIPTGLL
jgi:nucleotide-binding universal stress UspA family protein